MLEVRGHTPELWNWECGADRRNTKKIYGVYRAAASFQQEVWDEENRREEVVGSQVQCGGFHILLPFTWGSVILRKRLATDSGLFTSIVIYWHKPQPITRKEKKIGLIEKCSRANGSTTTHKSYAMLVKDAGRINNRMDCHEIRP